ncbi:hypothetical protein ACHHYP_06181 [Achlya hypogyna]|uniref:Uncharacterized protein n=1 Tax=Achlya hypogyna TaxID=1202772 RepID=A0A1V9YV37_ACHHY|nr:hypothetical protein ACHHYP_06181 [Achlya hypogyna]
MALLGVATTSSLQPHQASPNVVSSSRALLDTLPMTDDTSTPTPATTAQDLTPDIAEANGTESVIVLPPSAANDTTPTQVITEAVTALEAHAPVQQEEMMALHVAPANNNGAGFWGGRVRIVNHMPKVCIYTDKTVTWFSGNGRGDLTPGASVTLGPFGGGWYTLGVQENVFANCAYAGSCAWNNHSADNYCYNFSVDQNCHVHWNDCPYPPGRNGGPSPAPDGRKRYTISGSIDGSGTCVLDVNPTGQGPYFCDAHW